MALSIIALVAAGLGIATVVARGSRTLATGDAARALPPSPASSAGTGGAGEDPPISRAPEGQSAGVGCWLPIVFVIAQFVALIVIVLIGMNEAGYDVCDRTYAPPSSMDRWCQRAVALVSLLPFVLIAARSPRRVWWILIPVLLCGVVWASVLGSVPSWDPSSVRESCGRPSS